MNVEDEIHEIKKILAVMKERYNNDSESSKKQSEEVTKLTNAVNRLLLIIENANGFKDGKSTVMKWVWSIFGGFILAWVIWVSASIAKMPA